MDFAFNNNEYNQLLTQFHKINGSNYQDVWDFQSILHEAIKSSKQLNSNKSSKSKVKKLNHIVFCEHNHVITMGKSASEDNLVSDLSKLRNLEIELHKINRGGDITYHGPGQLTGYLIFDLEELYRDVHLYVRNIEECIIQLLERYGVSGQRIDNFTGVWIQDNSGLRKICAIGVHLSRWVSMHGFGLNVNTNLDYFENIIPCGISEKNMHVTSLSKELNKQIDTNELYLWLKEIISDVFGLEIIN